METNLNKKMLLTDIHDTEKVVAGTHHARTAYIDIIRLVLTVLVIMVHAAVTYGSAGDWTYIDGRSRDELTSALLTFFVIDCQAFFMALFFFFAGYFTPGSFSRKGIAKFWQDRLMHIGIPMLLYTFLFSRVPNYLDEVVNHGLDISFWQFSLKTFISDADEGPTWFLFALLVFTLGYTLWRLASRAFPGLQKNATTIVPFPSTWKLLAAGIIFGASMFTIAQANEITQPVDIFGIFSLLIAFFPFYITMFVGGIIAYRNN